MTRDKTIFTIIVLVCFCCLPAHAAHLHKEKEYQGRWCAEAEGITEYVLQDKSRVDCLTDEYAIEFDFVENWAESIGQACIHN